jgi:hypothetical protein
MIIFMVGRVFRLGELGEFRIMRICKVDINNAGPIIGGNVEESVINRMTGGGRREVRRTVQVTRKRMRLTGTAIGGEREAKE